MLKIQKVSSHALLLLFFTATLLSLLSVLLYGAHYHMIHNHSSISSDSQNSLVVNSNHLAVNSDTNYTKAAKTAVFNFSLPWHDGLSPDHYTHTQWFQSLVNFARRLGSPRKPVFLVCSDNVFKEVLLNWLISALVLQKEPTKNILVITNRNGVCSLVSKHGLPVTCFKIQARPLLTEDGWNQVKHHVFSQLLVIRLSVMRILNHLGHDVINMDADAIMLKNPIPMLERNGDSDVVGTFGGSLPMGLFKKWGLVVCMGAVMIRSTPATEHLWESMGQIERVRDDQILFNNALDRANISWTATSSHQLPTAPSSSSNSSNASLSTGWVGHAPSGLKVTLLPQGVACRGVNCREEVRGEVFIWHHGRNKHKVDNMTGKAAEDGVWFLRREWSKVEGAGLKWLRKISTL